MIPQKNECYHSILKATKDYVFCLGCGERFFSEFDITDMVRNMVGIPRIENINEVIEGWKKNV